MHKIHKVKDMLCEQLESYSNLEKVDTQSLDMIDKLAHAIKNIDKIIDRQEMAGEYSNYNPMMRGNSYGEYDDMPYRRSNMGRYSREDGYSMNNPYRQRM